MATKTIRKAVKDFGNSLRISTAGWRALPDFIIAGTQKGGTTSLYSYLAEHPRVIRATKKEVHFFESPLNRIRGRDWYLSHFPLKLNLKVKRAITGEATTFMYPFHVPRLVHEMMPEVKIVFLLRDPIDRAFSHYKHNLRRSGRETLSFGQAIRQEHTRISAALERSMADEWYNDEDNRMYSYIARGLYARQIKRWKEFFSSDQMLILESEKFYENPQSILDCVTDFLGLERHKFNTTKQYNVGGYADGILEADRRYLEDIFADENNALFTLIGKNFWQPK